MVDQDPKDLLDLKDQLVIRVTLDYLDPQVHLDEWGLKAIVVTLE